MAVYPFIPGQADNYDTGLLRTAWDTVQLGQFVLPGISTVQISRPRKYSVKMAKDHSYATIKDTGLELAKITITNVIGGVSLYIPGDIANTLPIMTKYEAQLSTLEDILKYFDTQLGFKTKSTNSNGDSVPGFAVNHPALQMRGINSIYIEDIDGPITSRPGFITTVFKCVEVRNAKATSTKKVDPGKSFAQGSAFSNTPNNNTTPPNQNPASRAPK